jgi:hypothetical protein
LRSQGRQLCEAGDVADNGPVQEVTHLMRGLWTGGRYLPYGALILRGGG